jgi:hypothetical protein
MTQKSATAGSPLVALGEASILKAQNRVVACQGCSASVSRPFGSVLAEILGASTPLSEYLLCAPAQCPNCDLPIVESTLVRCEGEIGEATTVAVGDLTPCSDDVNVILINERLLSEAQAFISGCERCSVNAEMTFDYILDAVTGHDPSMTEYVMCRPATCPRCCREVTEKTRVVVSGIE